MGPIDRIIRVVLVVVVGILYRTVQISNIPAVILCLFAAIFLMTSEVESCYLYVPLGISTIRKKRRIVASYEIHCYYTSLTIRDRNLEIHRRFFENLTSRLQYINEGCSLSVRK
jgi:hypothetical protein